MFSTIKKLSFGLILGLVFVTPFSKAMAEGLSIQPVQTEAQGDAQGVQVQAANAEDPELDAPFNTEEFAPEADYEKFEGDTAIE